MEDLSQDKSATEQNHPPPVKMSSPKSTLAKLLPVLLIVVIIAVGLLSGLVLASRQKSQVNPQAAGASGEAQQKVSESFSQTFKDQTEGTIQKNDKLEKYAQGTHKLIRPGGDSQTAYLTSSVLDLDQYLGKKVKVYGETFGSSQVGWLMDVG